MASSPAISNFKQGYCASALRLITPANSPHPSQKNLALLLEGPVSTPHLLQIHARVFRLGVHQDSLIATRLIGRHHPHFALHILHHLYNPSIFPFNAAIRVLSESGLVSSAFSVFKSLKVQSLLPNDFTFSFLLKACFRCRDAWQVWQVHAHVVKSGFDMDSSVCSGMLLVYAKGVQDVVSARKLFDGMPEKGNASCWTCLIAGYAQLDMPEEALTLFLRMLRESVMSVDDTMVSVLSACSKIIDVENWIDKFSENGFGFSEFSSDSTDTVLIYLYGKMGKIEKSRDLFDKMADRRRGRMSVVSWNAIISSYVQNGHPVEALDLFRWMVAVSSPKPNHVTMVSMLSACSQVGDLELGRWAHSYIKTKDSRRVLESNTILATAFIDMYSKCGSLEGAKEVFHGIVRKDIVIFNAMITGLAVNGEGEEATRIFHEMGRIGLHPNEGTFLGLLSACTHSGLIGEGRAFFEDMQQLYSITPKLEHYACYIDLLGRGGHIDEALELVGKMPMEPNAQIWGALLGACLVHVKAGMARYVAGKLVDVDPRNSAGYVMLSNAYAADLQWGEIADLRGTMKDRGVRKQPGGSWISVEGAMHEFFVGVRSHPQIQSIHNMLDGLYREMTLIGQ